MPPKEASMTFRAGPSFFNRFLFLHAGERRHPENSPSELLEKPLVNHIGLK